MADFPGVLQPLPALREASAGLGTLSKNEDGDGIVRKAPLLFLHDGELVPALSLEALRVAQGADAVLVRTSFTPRLRAKRAKAASSSLAAAP